MLHQVYSAEGEIETLDQTQLQSVWLFRDGPQQQKSAESNWWKHDGSIKESLTFWNC